MDRYEIFEENFRSYCKMLGGFGTLREYPSGSFASATGISSAGENYALLSASAAPEDVRASDEFFREARIPFVTPQLPGTPDNILEELDLMGLKVREVYTAMYTKDRPLCPGSQGQAAEASDGRRAREWAQGAWFGFGGEKPFPASYADFAQYLRKRKENRLFYFRKDGIAVSTALLHYSKHACGLYYFATLPEYRRKGFAKRLLRAIEPAAYSRHSHFVLLATQAGLPFYLDFGFTAIAQIPVRSYSEEL